MALKTTMLKDGTKPKRWRMVDTGAPSKPKEA